MIVGTNVDPRHGYDPADIAGPGVGWVRSVVRPDHDLGPWLNACHAAGLKVLVVIARESLRRGWTYGAAARHYAARYGGWADAWQIGNESDHRSPSSWTLPVGRVGKLVDMFHTAMPNATLIGPGLVSGQPDYAQGLPANILVAIAIHPYGRGPSAGEPYAFGPVEDLAGLYRRFDKPIWVTEWGGPIQDFASEHERAKYHSKMLLALRDAGVEAAFQFCWSDGIVPGFGLVDAQGNAKESYAAFYDGAIAAQQPAAPAILDYRGQLPKRAGRPYWKRPLEGIDHAVIHYTAGSAAATVEDVARYQTGPGSHLPFPEIAYHLFVGSDGSVAWCHDFDVRTWGSDGAGWNERAVHICYGGAFQPTNAQLGGLRAAILHAQQGLRHDLIVVGHKNTSQTECPGPTWANWRWSVLP